MTKGFILNSHVQERRGDLRLIFYVRAEKNCYKLIFTGQKIVFFIKRSDRFDPTTFSFERKQVGLKSFSDDPVDAIYLKALADLKLAKDYCEQQGIRTFEIDVSITERFLMERFIFGGIEFEGEVVDGEIINPKVKPSFQRIIPTQMALDIETGIGGELYSIAFAFRGTVSKNLVLMLSDKESTESDELLFYSSEQKMIQAFLEEVYLLQPDIISGWHVIGFDLMFLEKKCQQFGMELALGRNREKAILDHRQGAGFTADIRGRVVLDGPVVLRSAFYQFKNFKLETVAQEVLNLGKDIASDENKVDEIERRFREDKVSLAKYNLLDCTLVIDIFDHLGIINLLLERSYLSGLQIDRLNVSTAAFDYVYLPKLHRKGYVALNRSDIERDEGSAGGWVFAPEPGLFRSVAVFDFKSLYPSIIKTFKIDPLSLIKNHVNTIKTPEGYQFSATEHLLPQIITDLFEARAQAKHKKNHPLDQAIKILMNSFYGIMGSSRSRFYHADLPSAITTTGHFILKTAKDFFENRGYRVLYGDTDSLFVQIDTEIDFQALALACDDFFKTILKQDFQVESYLECEFEKKYDQIYFLPMRSGVGGAKKRYVGMSRGEIEFKGVEAIRSDWTELAKDFQKELYQRFFTGEDIEGFIKSTIDALEQGAYDQKVVYTKRLSKPAQEYTKNIPPHVKAALKVDHQGPYPLREVSYVYTRLGPEPIQNNPSDIDYSHYIEKQIKPIADDVLVSLGTNFDSIRLGDQLSLF